MVEVGCGLVAGSEKRVEGIAPPHCSKKERGGKKRGKKKITAIRAVFPPVELCLQFNDGKKKKDVLLLLTSSVSH